MNQRVLRIAPTLLVFVLTAGCGNDAGSNQPATKNGANTLTVVCSFFPIYHFTKNVVGDQPGVEVKLMLPAEMGCPHDYDLKPDDVKLLSKADLFIINGAGLDNFNEKAIAAANPRLWVIDTSANINTIDAEHEDGDHDHDKPKAKEKIKDDHDHDHDKPKPKVKGKGDDDDHDHEREKSSVKSADKKAHKTDHNHDHGHHHEGGKNPHFFSSPAQAARQVAKIAESLAAADPKGAEKYKANANAFVKKLKALDADFKTQAKKFTKRKIVTVHEVFDYLAQDCDLQVVATIRTSPEHDPSAGEMRQTIEQIKKSAAAAVFAEPQYSTRAAEVVAKEAGVPVFTLDPVASGPADAPLDYYEKVQRKNLETLSKALGGVAP